jgi:hypothetical protein
MKILSLIAATGITLLGGCASDTTGDSVNNVWHTARP